MRCTSVLLLMVVLLAGCSTTSRDTNFSEEQWNRHFYDCARGSQMISSSAGQSLYARQAMVFDRCMTDRGYVGYAKN